MCPSLHSGHLLPSPPPGSEALTCSRIYHLPFLPPVTPTFLLAHFLAPSLLSVPTPEKGTRQEAHLGEHGCHGAQALSALLLQVLLLVRPGLQAQVLQVVDILQEDVETLGLVGSPGFPHGLYVADHFLSGEKGNSFSGLRGLLPPQICSSEMTPHL